MKRRVEMKTTGSFWVSVFIFVCMMYSCKPYKETRAQKISDIKEETAKSTQADETPSPSVEKKERTSNS
ncbi:MAG: hypothetical protein IPJ13_02735 [Saprospiraceae bacterium]|nr:hypothetical protein [Saprospiraceae bacterium]